MTTHNARGEVTSANNFAKCGWAGNYTFRCQHCGETYRGGGQHVVRHHTGECAIGLDYCKWCVPGKGCRVNDPNGLKRDWTVATHGWNR